MIVGARRNPTSVTEPPTGASEILDLLHQLREGQPAWHRDALCREFPDVSFFPGPGQSAGPALQVCGRCLVRVECLNAALKDPDSTGVWGGSSRSARNAIRIARNNSTNQKGT